jgi:NADPH-dependent 2,4-dienoyl-CoA reductase/sulfur reductase-like enzyme
MRIAVIGGTASGPAAAAEAVRTNPRAEVVLFEEGAHISVGACEIPYFVAGRLHGEADLEVLTAEAFERTRGAQVRLHHRVVGLEPERGRLVVEALRYGSRHEEPFDRFVLATGARARRLGVEGEAAAGVFAVRTYDDAVAIKGWLDAEPVRHVVVAGGGYVGLEMAEAMRDRGLRATILDPRGRVLASSLSAALAGPMDAAVRAAGVPVRAETITRIEADRHGRVRAVRTDRGEVIGCQAVLVGVGVAPRTELAVAAGVKLGKTGAVAVDAHMRTSRRNVWACGDLVEMPRVVDGAPVHWPLAPVGRRTARVAARNAAGQRPPDRFAGLAGAVAVRAFGVEAARVGLTLEEAEAAGFDAVAADVRHWSRTSVYPGARPLLVRLVVERPGGRLLGGELVGEEGAALRADVLVPLVASGATARALAEDLDLVYNPPVAPSVDPLKIAAAEALKRLGARRQTRSSRP